jgi:hypothetical protein
MTEYAKIGKTNNLYENDVERQYTMIYGDTDINRVERAINPKNISANVLNDESTFDAIIEKQKKAINDMLK